MEQNSEIELRKNWNLKLAMKKILQTVESIIVAFLTIRTAICWFLKLIFKPFPNRDDLFTAEIDKHTEKFYDLTRNVKNYEIFATPRDAEVMKPSSDKPHPSISSTELPNVDNLNDSEILDILKTANQLNYHHIEQQLVPLLVEMYLTFIESEYSEISKDKLLALIDYNATLVFSTSLDKFSFKKLMELISRDSLWMSESELRTVIANWIKSRGDIDSKVLEISKILLLEALDDKQMDVNWTVPRRGATFNYTWSRLFSNYEIENQVIITDLGKCRRVNSMSFNLLRSDGYVVEVSEDQETWNKIIDYSDFNCRYFQKLFFDETCVRYIKISGREKAPRISNFRAELCSTPGGNILGFVEADGRPTYQVKAEKRWACSDRTIIFDQPHYVKSIKFKITKCKCTKRLRCKALFGDEVHKRVCHKSEWRMTRWDKVLGQVSFVTTGSVAVVIGNEQFLASVK